MTPRLDPFIVLVCVIVGPLAVPTRTGAQTPRLRFLDAPLQTVARTAEQRSTTFRALVERLRRGDVVVYVRFGELPDRIIGRLAFLSAAGGLRYVVVDVAAGLNEATTIAILGHELQHAVEVLEQPQIRDQRTFAAAYDQSGAPRRRLADGTTGFDTAAAVAAGQQIRLELAAPPPAAVATR